MNPKVIKSKLMEMIREIEATEEQDLLGLPNGIYLQAKYFSNMNKTVISFSTSGGYHSIHLSALELERLEAMIYKAKEERYNHFTGQSSQGDDEENN